MNVTLIILLGVIVLACAVAVLAVVSLRERRALLTRMSGAESYAAAPIPILRTDDEGFAGRIGSWLKERTPTSWGEAGEVGGVLVHAGFDGPMAPIFYATLRLAAMVLLPLLGLLIAPKDNVPLMAATVGVGFAMGLIGPRAILDRLATRRRDAVRRSLPDCLDLMVVCVEAGVSLDAAMLRVARDMELAHPILSHELLIVNRKMNAGLTRDQAVNGLWTRTGVEELRGLTSSIIQSERLGTSIARVLRVNAETLRRKRRQHAEKKAAEAALKMIIPLGLFMLPALFAMILGPAALKAASLMRALQSTQ